MTPACPAPRRPTRAGTRKNAYVREDRILLYLPALHLRLTKPVAEQRRRRTRRGVDAR
jgi:hypothetical protein